MPHHPQTHLLTHEVTNQAPPLEDYDLFSTDVALGDALRTFSPASLPRAAAFGVELGTAEHLDAGRLANRFPPELRAFDRYGHRLDEVEFHPSYHQLFALAMRHGVHNAAWDGSEGGSHSTHLALEYLFSQVEQGIACPLTMTYASIPTLRHNPALAADWEPRATSSVYDPRSLPAHLKTANTIGMAMTEKQGGSDVRANTTRATETADGWRLRGHKWFCSAPMSDAFFTLAYTDAGLGCFFVPRWQPDGTRNTLQVMRLKDKLGNKSNASSEIEYHDAWAVPVGEPGRGVRTILDMVTHTRLDCTIAAAAITRAAFVQAAHHAQHRKTFGKRLIEQPLMRNVLADLAVEQEAALWLSLRLASAYDRGATDPQQAALARIGVAVGKYYTNKRCPTLVVEAMECLGGAGYVEEGPLPRLYREAPLNGIWEGSGNVICLDVLRAMSREPQALAAMQAELSSLRGLDRRLDAALGRLHAELSDSDHLEYRARRIVEQIGVVWQAGLLLRHAPPAVADAWCATRLGGGLQALGTLPTGIDTDTILTRAWPH